MKKQVFFITLILLSCSGLVTAQVTTDFAYKKYSWDTEPKLRQLSDKEKQGNYTILKDKIMIEYAYEASGQLVQYATRHMIVHFNTQKGIEEMNKVYISMGSVLEEMDLKARTITSQGKVIPLNKGSIKKVDDLEDAGPYMIFAMEGVDIGGEIEYLYTNKKHSDYNSSWLVQGESFKKQIEVDIYSPKNLVYEARGYNGFPTFSSDSSNKEKNHIYAKLENVEGLIEEKYSTYVANKMRFDYQLTYNSYKGKARLFTWEYCGNDLYNSVFKLEKSENKAIDKLINKLGLNNMKTDEQKIRTLESYMKTSINLSGDVSEVDKVLDAKIGDRLGLVRIYVGVAKALNIPVEAVLTTDRTKSKFDNNFQSWNSLKEYMIYFSDFDKYLTPSDYLSRLGFPTPQLTNNKGLFIKETVLGEIKTGISKIKTIEAPSYKLSHNNINATVAFNAETFLPTVNFKQDFLGYSAYSIQPTLIYLEPSQVKEIMDNLSKFIGKECVVKSTKYSGTEKADILVAPLVIESVIETPQLIENAGNKYLFKVGELIGEQEELYQEKTRQTDAEITYNHSFGRTLEVKIPTGYHIKNLEDIRIDKKYVVDGKTLASFVSDYKLEGNVLKITVYEDYETIVYPKANFEQFRSVINASADFNKVVLIFEK